MIPDDLTWHVTPNAQDDHAIDVSYARDGEGERFICRRIDRATRETTYRQLAFHEAHGVFEPRNNRIPHGAWRPVTKD